MTGIDWMNKLIETVGLRRVLRVSLGLMLMFLEHLRLEMESSQLYSHLNDHYIILLNYFHFFLFIHSS
jgi:hypothetical protein